MAREKSKVALDGARMQAERCMEAFNGVKGLVMWCGFCRYSPTDWTVVHTEDLRQIRLLTEAGWLLEKYSKEVEVLKEEVKDMLVLDHHVGAEKMVLIDALERLGVSYLFQKEIEELLENMFPKFEEYSHVFHDNLFMVSLHFRVFRQHGYDLSSDAFERFTHSNGEFKETISSDVMGMLSLYEATFLKTHGEDILDKAFCFTKTGLESLKPHLSSTLAEQVTHALYQPLQRGIPRVEARHYISVYEKDASRNEKLLRLAKIDFNQVQMLHKEELYHISRWWKEWDLRSHIPYVRDRAVECFFYSTAMIPTMLMVPMKNSNVSQMQCKGGMIVSHQVLMCRDEVRILPYVVGP
ncbi:valerianol synthase TPS1A-like [Rhododendron vialii]|uniref:valerianol synthase TPS1A-like n=1 Tax=Rhododendron vialii TaxID=182163 RepID=UPI00265E8B10|nr:valerianol synthase TPS1A-like [Rhododendron vialii]